MSEIKSPSIKLKVSQNVEAASAQPKYARYSTRLKQMDKDGDGTIDMDEMCEAIDQMVEREKQNSLLKKVACVSGLMSLLTIAAVVGLVAAVIIESEELSSSDNVITTPGGSPLYVSLPSLTANMSQAASRRRNLLADGGCSQQPEEWGSVDIDSLNTLCKALQHDAGLQLAINMASDACSNPGDGTCTSRTMLQVDGESCSVLASPPACGDTSTWNIVTGYDGNSFEYTIAVERTCPDNTWNRPVISRSCDSSNRPLTNTNSTDGISIEATKSCGAVDYTFEIEKEVQPLKPGAVKTAKVKEAVPEKGINYWASIPRSTVEYWCKCQATASNELGRTMLFKSSGGDESTGQEIQFDSAVCNETVKPAAQLEILAFVKTPDYSTQVVVQCMGNSKSCKTYDTAGVPEATAPAPSASRRRDLRAIEELRNNRQLSQGCNSLDDCPAGEVCYYSEYDTTQGICFVPTPTIKPSPPPPPDSGGCFPGNSTVILKNGSYKTMANLQVGDTVQVIDTKTGKLEWSEVYAFLEYETASLTNYVNIVVEFNSTTTTTTEISKTLQLTGNHFVYYRPASKASGADISKARLIHAKKVKVDDIMWVAGRDGKALAGTVVGIYPTHSVGAYAPHTLVGSIVVDGVVAHCMADMELTNGVMWSDLTRLPPEWYTAFTAPLRLLHRLGFRNTEIIMKFNHFERNTARVLASVINGIFSVKPKRVLFF